MQIFLLQSMRFFVLKCIQYVSDFIKYICFRLTVPLCAIEVVAPEIRTSLITMDNLVIKNLNVLHVLGAYNLNNIIFDSMATLENIDFSTKLFTGQVFVHNILVSNIKGTDLIGNMKYMHK